ncbi:MAG TPA: hypothetical protein VGP92_03660 [Acidimicrobiia bacterium]|nr:hypothetical protein [Acidimicrobiia bacterium]
MRDALEERLASRLGALGETVDDELVPPVDLELQVVRHRNRARAARRWASLGVAATIVAAVTTVAVVHGTSGRGALRIATSSTTLVPARDALQPGTVMLSARGRYVVSLDAKGHTNATMISARHGDIVYARATDDHRALWYLSMKKGPSACGDVVRADIGTGHSSEIITHAVAFDVSPDGSRLALYGAGDLAHDRCTPMRAGAQGRIVVLDLATGKSSALTVGSIAGMRWSPDGSYLVSVSCSAGTCSGYDVIDVPTTPGAALVPEAGALSASPARLVHSAHIAFGPDGLYALETTTPFPHASTPPGAGVRIAKINPRSSAAQSLVLSTGSEWKVSQVIPTAVGTYVVAARATPGGAAPTAAASNLYRVDRGRLTFVRPLPNAGTFTPVTPLADAG